ncbi:MAG: energy transducer TonB [Candidatus Methylacidiphilaceae bacterium]
MDRERWIGIGVSVALHAAILFGISPWIVQKAQYGMAQGPNSVAIDLVEGASEPEETSKALPPPEPAVEPAREEMPQLAEQKPAPPVPAVRKAPEKPPRTLRHVALRGKGSAGTGRDALSLSRSSGSTNAQPDYLRNPPPPYPEECRCRGEQGTVVLKVLVSPRGAAESVAVSRSSGFGPLDRAALDAVRRWRFRAATMGGVPVQSYVVVPIRFLLEN